MLNIQSCIIVGCGVSGLIAARKLMEYNIDLTMLEKGRGPGGRMATTQFGEAIFDHGAQFVTTREQVFRERVEGWLNNKVVRPWYKGPLGNMRYAGMEGINSIARHLSRELNMRFSEKVEKMAFKNGIWTVTTKAYETGKTQNYKADFLILTPPVPQSLDMIRNSNIEIDYDEEEELSRIEYVKCLTILAQLNGPAGIPNPGAMDLNHDILRWIVDNHSKGISKVPGSVTIHTSPKYSEQHWDTPDEVRIPPVLAAAKPFLKSDVTDTSFHRWGYSEPMRIYKEKQPFRLPYFLDEDHRLAMCGDGFNGPRIEAAALSGLNLAERLVKPI